MSHLEAIEKRIFPFEELLRRVENWRLKDRRVVFTNGCFDVLHVGHVNYLTRASEYGDRLIVAVNSDVSVKAIKGNDRPINSEDARAFVVAGIHYVNAVTIFNEETPESIIKLIKPDVLVKGGDYDPGVTNPSDPKYIVGSEYVKGYGGEVVTIPFVEGFSSSSIIEKLKA